MKQEESLLILTEIASSLGYNLESKASTGFFSLPLYISFPLILLPINLLLFYNNMSQVDTIQAE